MEDHAALRLLQLRSKGILTQAAVGLFLYFSSSGGVKVHHIEEIHKLTGIAQRTIRYTMPLLELTRLIEVTARGAPRNGGGFSVRVHDADSDEVRKATGGRGNLKAIKEYRSWQYKERNHARERKTDG